jgi:hypothetical protein
MDTVTLYRPVGPRELDLIKTSGWREFPSTYLSRHSSQTVGGAVHTEYWVPAEELPEFNAQ